ncbi:MAG: GDP-mannose 4,6-dehydratase [Candidatus Omnitrophica bacterium]|nr:GDP-mannose 4,6-dehydratase [Candidatus Omnitrophota bacterium]
MRLKDKTILLTGAGGFIGSHLAEALVKKASKVKALVRYNSKRNCGNLEFLDKKIKKEIDINFADIRETGILSKVMQGVDVVFNLAALVGIPYSYVNPHEVAMVNTIGTLNVLKAARDAEVEKFVQTSTSEVYGSPDRVPIKEKDQLKPQSPYSASKIGSDSMALSFFYAFDMPVSIIRPFNTYGPRQSSRAVIPTIINQALTTKTIRLGSLTPRRDFTYVKDTVEGFIKVAESKNSIGEVINIGTGRDVSVAEIMAMVERILGVRLKVVKDSKRIRPIQSEVTRLLADNSKAKKLLNWEPKVDLKKGLKLTIDFVAKNPNLYDPKIYAV